jgi:hypothetical protein
LAAIKILPFKSIAIMKKLCFFLFVISFLPTLSAQAPSQFRYQAVARDAGGTVITGNIDIRFSLLEDDASGVARYQEKHTAATNAQGVFELTVGKGSVISGDLETVDWAHHQYWLKVEMKAPGASDFTAMGSSQLLSVPYAMFAKESGDHLVQGPGISINNGVISNTGDLSDNNELQTLSVNGNQLNISNGNTVTLPTGTTYTEGAGIEFNGNSISALDISPTNEIQTLSLNGQQLSLSNGGGSVQLPGGTSAWTINGNTTYNNPVTNNVGIGTTSSPNAKLDVVASGNLLAGDFTSPGAADAMHTYCNGTGAGIIAGSLNGTGGSFTSVTGTAGRFSSSSGPGLIVAQGKVGIGTSNPIYLLEVEDGTIKAQGKSNGESPAIIATSHNGGTAISAFAYDGGDAAHLEAINGACLYVDNITIGGLGTGIKLSTNLATWNMYGDVAADFNFACNGVLKAWIYDTDGSYHNSSDSRLKKDIKPFKNVLSGLTQLQAYTYHMKDAPDDSPVSVGFMAQEVEQQFPALVVEKNGYKSLCYDQFAVLSVEAIKEQQEQINQQQTLITSQQTQLDTQAIELKTMQDDFAELKQMVLQLMSKK